MVENNYRFEMSESKWNIFESAIYLFSEKTYFNVSLRDIAKEVGVQPGAIYNHFSSKDHILSTMYDYYVYWVRNSLPTMDVLERAIAEEHPHQVVRRLVRAEFPFEIHEILCQCFVIIVSQLACDRRAQNVLLDTLADPSTTPIRHVLTKMQEMGKIEPLHIDSFIMLYLGATFYFTYSIARNVESTTAHWATTMEDLISQIKVVEAKA